MYTEAELHQNFKSFPLFHKYIQEFVYGGIDGSVTTFAVVAGAAGAELQSSIVVILGFTNLFADGFAMSVGNYLSQKSIGDNFEKHKKREYWEIENLREKEVEEIRDIYSKKGFQGKLLEDVVSVITSDKDRWVDVMMKEELEMMPEQKSPFKSGLMTFCSFVSIGLLPLTVYVIDFLFGLSNSNLFLNASVLTSLGFICIGFMKSYVTQTSHVKGIFETLLLGALAAIVAYYVGDVLGKIIIG